MSTQDEITIERVLAVVERLTHMPDIDPKTMSIIEGCRRAILKGVLSDRQHAAFLGIERRSHGDAPTHSKRREVYDVLVSVPTLDGTGTRWHNVGSAIPTSDGDGFSVRMFSTPFNWDGSLLLKKKTLSKEHTGVP